MKHAELFAGYGGLGLAVEEVFGAELAWYAEFDAAPSKIMARHWPGVPNYGDVTAVDWSAVEPVDIISGGYPCQPFSQAGRRGGITDERHLWPYVAEALDVIRPKYGVFENVRGHLSLGLDQVIRDLHLLGYDVQWTVNRASDIGAPHRRERIFLLAKDRYAPVRSRTDRRRGLYRHPGDGRFFPGALKDSDVRQGKASAGRNGETVRREHVRLREEERELPRQLYLGDDRGEGTGGHSQGQTLATGEARGCRDCCVISAHAGDCGQIAEWPTEVDGRDEVQSETADGPDSRSQPTRPGPRAGSEHQGAGAISAIQRRPLVGYPRFPVWPGAIYGELPCEREHEGRDCVCTRPQSLLAWRRDAVTANGDGRRDGRGTIAPGQGRGERADVAPIVPTGAHGRTGAAEQVDLLPTPEANVASNGGSQHPDKRRAGGHSVSIQDVVEHADFGTYAPAIQRWEQVLGRPAPPPTELSPRGKHRLSEHFTEFMMGLPAGWICDTEGITRKDAIKMAGNGVVPQQAYAALTDMLDAFAATDRGRAEA